MAKKKRRFILPAKPPGGENDKKGGTETEERYRLQAIVQGNGYSVRRYNKRCYIVRRPDGSEGFAPGTFNEALALVAREIEETKE